MAQVVGQQKDDIWFLLCTHEYILRIFVLLQNLQKRSSAKVKGEQFVMATNRISVVSRDDYLALSILGGTQLPSRIGSLPQ